MGIEKTGKTVRRIADRLSTQLGYSKKPTRREIGRQKIKVG